MKRRRSNEATIENVLDQISRIREELLAVERSLERIQADKSETGEEGIRKTSGILH